MDKIKLTPRKEFFINMITRDITLEACILELIDNSIDGSIRAGVEAPEIILSFLEDEISINDNCGGIPLEIAKEYAFNFGKSEKAFDESNIENSIGRFGIGMKRSIFKMGQMINVKTFDSVNAYEIAINVEVWKNSDEWDLDYSNNDKKSIGTEIVISNLNNGIEEIIKQPTFAISVKRMIASKFREYFFENENLSIKIIYYGDVIEVEVDDYYEELVNNELIRPIVQEIEINGVCVKFVVGMIKRIDQGKYNLKKAGWYLYCNNRIVIEADRSNLTGWGTGGLKQFHPNPGRRFRGYCYMSSSDSRKLPWNTTKSSVEEESKIYIEAKRLMVDFTMKYLGIIEKVEELDQENNEDASLIKKYDSTGIKVGKNINLQNSDISAVYSKVMKTLPDKITIAYKKNRNEVNQIQKQYNLGTAADLGRMTYNYFLEMEDVKWE